MSFAPACFVDVLQKQRLTACSQVFHFPGPRPALQNFVVVICVRCFPLILLDCGSVPDINVILSCSMRVSVHERHASEDTLRLDVCVHVAALWSPHSSVERGRKSPAAETTLCVVLPQLPRLVPAAAGEEHKVS